MRLIRQNERVAQRVINKPVVRPRRFSGIKNDWSPKSIWKYIHLECGHMVTPEHDERYRVWRPKKGLHFCEYHTKWVKQEKAPLRAPIPDEPMF